MKNSSKLPKTLSLVWFIFSIFSFLGIGGVPGLIFFAINMILLVIYWILYKTVGIRGMKSFLINSRFYAHILEISNMLLGVKNLKKEILQPNTILKYRILSCVAIAILLFIYFFLLKGELVEKIATILFYSPFIFFILDGKKTALLIFVMLMMNDFTSVIVSGYMNINAIIKWLVLTIILLNTYTAEITKEAAEKRLEEQNNKKEN